MVFTLKVLGEIPPTTLSKGFEMKKILVTLVAAFAALSLSAAVANAQYYYLDCPTGNCPLAKAAKNTVKAAGKVAETAVNEVANQTTRVANAAGAAVNAVAGNCPLTAAPCGSVVYEDFAPCGSVVYDDFAPVSSCYGAPCTRVYGGPVYGGCYASSSCYGRSCGGPVYSAPCARVYGGPVYGGCYGASPAPCTRVYSGCYGCCGF